MAYLAGLNGRCFLSICAFFGHRDTPMSNLIENHLIEVVRGLILYHQVNEFWLCEQGTFDNLTRIVMKELKKEFEYINLCLFPAYYPNNFKLDWMYENDYDLLYPEEVAKAPPQVAILRRNEYIAKNADYIVCYVERQSGGAYKAVEKARKYGKKIINLAEYI